MDLTTTGLKYLAFRKTFHDIMDNYYIEPSSRIAKYFIRLSAQSDFTSEELSDMIKAAKDTMLLKELWSIINETYLDTMHLGRLISAAGVMQVEDCEYESMQIWLLIKDMLDTLIEESYPMAIKHLKEAQQFICGKSLMNTSLKKLENLYSDWLPHMLKHRDELLVLIDDYSDLDDEDEDEDD